MLLISLAYVQPMEVVGWLVTCPLIDFGSMSVTPTT